jgi:hypothetical protein
MGKTAKILLAMMLSGMVSSREIDNVKGLGAVVMSDEELTAIVMLETDEVSDAL